MTIHHSPRHCVWCVWHGAVCGRVVQVGFVKFAERFWPGRARKLRRQYGFFIAVSKVYLTKHDLLSLKNGLICSPRSRVTCPCHASRGGVYSLMPCPRVEMGHLGYVLLIDIFRSKVSNHWHRLVGLFLNPRKVIPPPTECGDVRWDNAFSIRNRTLYIISCPSLTRGTGCLKKISKVKINAERRRTDCGHKTNDKTHFLSHTISSHVAKNSKGVGCDSVCEYPRGCSVFWIQLRWCVRGSNWY
jgi:hypothetical protein